MKPISAREESGVGFKPVFLVCSIGSHAENQTTEDSISTTEKRGRAGYPDECDGEDIAKPQDVHLYQVAEADAGYGDGINWLATESGCQGWSASAVLEVK